MHATIDVRFELNTDDNKTLPLATLADSITDMDLEAMILEETVRSLDEQLVEAYCGEKHAYGNGTSRYQRAGTTTRSAVTTAGEHEFTLHNVEDTDATEDESSYFRPIEDLVVFDGQKIYQQGISMRAVDLATKLSYRDAVAEGDGFTPMPSASTINRRVKDYGTKLGDFLGDRLSGTRADTIVPDGTKCHSQDESSSYHDVNVTLGQSTASNETETTLLNVNVNDAWDETATTLEETDAITDDARVVSDADESVVNAFVGGDRVHQLDLLHLCRTTSYTLWDDDAFPLGERKAIVTELTGDVFHLKNSVEKHRPKGERSAIRTRIDRTLERMKRLAWQMEMLSSPKTAAYLRKWSSSAVTFAEFAIDGVAVPWMSNVVERAMGEVSKRCKNQWMRWTELGLESMLRLVLVRYANPEQYAAFEDEIIQRSDKNAISTTILVEATRGKL